MTLALLLLFSLGVGAIGAGVGYGYGHQEGVRGTEGYSAGYRAALEHVHAVKLRPIRVRTELPADYAIESIQLGAYQLLSDTVLLPALGDGWLHGLRGRWIVSQHARMTVRLRCLRTGVFRYQTSESEEETTLP